MAVNSYLSRISGAPWFDAMKEESVTIVGLGGIGSHLVYGMGRLGINSMQLYDFDTVEEVNLTGQLFTKDNIGHKKEDVVLLSLHKYSDFLNVGLYGKFLYPGATMTDPATTLVVNVEPDDYSVCLPYTICGLDNMEARKGVFERWLYTRELMKLDETNSAFIDGRLAAEDFQILTIRTKKDIEKYQEEFLFSDAETDATVCSYKQTTYSAMMIAGMMTNIFVNIIFNKHNGELRRVPFFLEMECSILNLKLE